MPTVIGWERNERQKLGPRMVDLRDTMDPGRCVGLCVPNVLCSQVGMSVCMSPLCIYTGVLVCVHYGF